MTHRNYMGSMGGTCNEKGYTCDHEEKLISNIKREIDPKTGKVVSEIQEVQAFYQCRHCHTTYQIGTLTTDANEVITFDKMLELRREELKRQQEEAQAIKDSQVSLARR